MRTGFKWSMLLFCLYAAQGESAERLGGISDETEQPVTQSEQPEVDHQGKIIYRVICSPEGEQLPECMQPPVNDTFKTPQPRLEPENAATPAIPETKDQPSTQTDVEGQPAMIAEPIAHKKASTHKKRSKKSVKKPHQENGQVP